MHGQAPEWIGLIPAGDIDTRDERAYVNDDPKTVIAATEALRMEVGLPIDYDHATDLAAPNGRPAPAAGWLKEFKIRDGAIFARVEWTEAGRKAVTSGEYRYVSPVFDYSKKTGRITRILRAALTNNPALYASAIASRQSTKQSEGSMATATLSEDEKRVCAAFGMSPSSLTIGRARLADQRRRGKANAPLDGLTEDERTICRAFDMKPRELLAGRRH